MELHVRSQPSQKERDDNAKTLNHVNYKITCTFKKIIYTSTSPIECCKLSLAAYIGIGYCKIVLVIYVLQQTSSYSI